MHGPRTGEGTYGIAPIIVRVSLLETDAFGGALGLAASSGRRSVPLPPLSRVDGHFRICVSNRQPVPSQPVVRATLPMPRPLTSSCLALRSGSARHRADHGVCEDARFCKMNVTSDLGLDGTEAGVHALPDDAALELGEGARYVEE